MKHVSIEAAQARKEGYPAFMSPEHIALVLKRDAEKKSPNGKGSGLQPPRPVLSSPDRTPLSISAGGRGEEVYG